MTSSLRFFGPGHLVSITKRNLFDGKMNERLRFCPGGSGGLYYDLVVLGLRHTVRSAWSMCRQPRLMVYGKLVHVEVKEERENKTMDCIVFSNRIVLCYSAFDAHASSTINSCGQACLDVIWFSYNAYHTF